MVVGNVEGKFVFNAEYNELENRKSTQQESEGASESAFEATANELCGKNRCPNQKRESVIYSVKQRSWCSKNSKLFFHRAKNSKLPFQPPPVLLLEPIEVYWRPQSVKPADHPNTGISGIFLGTIQGAIIRIPGTTLSLVANFRTGPS